MKKVIVALGVAMLSVMGFSSVAWGKDKETNRSTVRQTSRPDEILLFSNGTIYIDADTKVSNLLVRDGKVAGWNIQVKEHDGAVNIDLKGGVAYPGFMDSHVHLMETGVMFHLGANLVGCNDIDSMAKALTLKVTSIPEHEIILGVGFSLSDYDKWSLEDLAKIDKVTGNRPAFLVDNTGHNAVINTAAIKLAGLDPGTPAPPGGKVIIENGRLTGMLREGAMTLPWNKIFAGLDAKDMKVGTMMMLKHWASIGYTGAVDLMGAPGIRTMRPDIFGEMEEKGTLPLRINYCYPIFNLGDVDDAANYRGKDTDMVRFVGCKIFVDGAFAAGEAWINWKNKQGNYGIQEIYTDDSRGKEYDLNRIVARVEEYGMNMHYHVQGERAIGSVLDALDKAFAENGRIKGIHTLIHLAFPADEQIERIKRFNGHVVTTVQPAFWSAESDTSHYYGDRAKEAYPIRKLVDGGISVGISTDFSVSPIEDAPATVIMRIAATGGGNAEVHQPLSIREVLHGLTQGSARTTGKEDTGKLDVGYKADIVVYDKDLNSVDPAKFTKDSPKVLSTWVSGRKAYEAPK